MLTACTTGTASPSASPSKESLVSTAGKAKGQVDLIRWDLPTGEPDTLDPPNAATYSGGQVVMNLCDTLVQYDANYNMSAGLASYKQVSPTKLVYTLRDGAKFWDGQAVTPADVVYSLERAKAGSIVSSFFADVSSVQATGANEVTVNFKTADEKFNTEMTNISGVIYEKAFAEKAGKNFGSASGGLMCSGPFKLDSWKSGDSITMSRNDGYWDTSRKPYAKKVVFSFITDTSALTQALQSGEIDGAYQIPAAAIPALQKASSGKVYFGPSTESISLLPANPGGITADADFMGGLQRIIDRSAIASVIFHGAAQPLYTNLTPRTWPTDQTATYQAAYDKWQKARSYNLSAAKTAIKKSAYKGQQLVIGYLAGDDTQTQLAQLLQQQAKQAGVAIKLQGLGSLAYSQASYTASKRQGLDFLLAPNFNSVADPLEPALFDFLPDSPYNYTGYNDAQTVSLLNQAVAAFDGAARAKLIIEAQDRWESQNVVVPLVSTNTVTFLSTKLSGAVTSFAYWSTPNMAVIGSAS